MTAPRPARPFPAWPGLLLQLLLPGSGFSYLGRPWQHLLALLLTLATWLAAWALAWVYAAAPSLKLAPERGDVCGGLSLLLLAGSYTALGWSYLRAVRRGAGTVPQARRRWAAIGLHVLLLLLAVWWLLVRLNPPY